MGTVGRGLKIIALLLGFYAMCALLIGVLVVVDIFTFWLAGKASTLDRLVIPAVLATAGVALVVIRGVFVSTRVRRKDLPGIPVSRAEQPLLWERVTALAAAAGTRPPTEIRLVPEVNAGVMEHAHLLGLVPGKRRMLIGAPLLVALTPAQFDAVLGHELGHYSGHDVRLGPLTARARTSVMGAVAAVRGQGKRTGWFRWPGQDLFGAAFIAYARWVLTTTFAASRRQELAADRLAAAIAGRANAASALREVVVIDASYGFYLNRYVAAGLPAGLLPPPAELLGSFAAFMSDPRRRAEMAAIRQEPPEETSDAYDSHPPTAERVAAILALPDDGRALDESNARALELVTSPGPLLTALGVQLVGDKATGKTAADWDTIARAARLTAAAGAARPLIEIVGNMTGAPPQLGHFLDLVDAARLDEMLDRLPPSQTAVRLKVTGLAAREFAKTALGPMVGGWVVTELLRAGQIGVRHSWADIGGELVMADELGAALQEGIDALLTMRPDTSPLRTVLKGTGIQP